MGFELGSGAVGNATPGQVLSPATFSSTASGVGVAGTMPDNGALGTYTPGTSAQAIPAGHTSGGTVAGDANLVGGNIKPGVSIFGVASTMPSQNAVNITPSTVSQTAIAAGTYAAGAATVSGDANLVSANIGYGASIFGVAGSYTTPIKVASGSATSGTTAATFYNPQGSQITSPTLYELSVPVPTGARQIIGVFILSGWNVAFFCPLGNVGNQGTSNLGYMDSVATYGTYFGTGGALSLTTTAIVVPAYYSASTYDYTVIYY